MGIVCIATDLQQDNKVVLKLIRPDKAGGVMEDYFDQEMQLMAKLEGEPRIARLYHSDRFHMPGTPAGQLCRYLVIEYFRGGVSIRRYVMGKSGLPSSAPLSWRERVGLMIEVCEAVGAAHAIRIVHRDLKPGNILARTAPGESKRPRREVKVIDWGIATMRGLDGWLDSHQIRPSGFQGTPDYMAPEQCTEQFDPETLTARTDVYALGVILYELLAGTLPYRTSPARAYESELAGAIARRENVGKAKRSARHAVCGAFGRDNLLPLSTRAGPVPVGLARIVDRALQLDPAERFADAGEMARALRGFVEGRTRRTLAVGAAVTAAAIYVAYTVGIPAVFEMTPLNTWYQTLLVAVHPGSAGTLDSVVLVAIDPTTDLTALSVAERLRIPDEGERISVRPLVARALEKAQEAGARVAAVDVFMASPSPGNDELLKDTLQTLNSQTEHFMPVVLAYKGWASGASTAGISSALGEANRRGGTMVQASGSSVWRVELLNQPPNGQVEPSLALAAYAAYRQQSWLPHYSIVPDGAEVEIRYETPLRSGLGPPPTVDHVALTSTAQPGKGEAAAGGVVGLLELASMPGETARGRSTVRLQAFLTMSPTDRQTLVAGKVVLLASMWGGPTHFSGEAPLSEQEMAAVRQGPDRRLQPEVFGDELDARDLAVSFPDQNLVPKAYTHAAAIAKLISGTVVTATDVPSELGLTALAAACGVAAAHMETRRRRDRALMVLAVIAGLMGFGVALYAWWDVLFNPMVPCLAAVTALVICLGIQHVMRPSPGKRGVWRALGASDSSQGVPTERQP